MAVKVSEYLIKKIFSTEGCRGSCASSLKSGTGIAGTSNFGGYGGGLADRYSGYGSSRNNNYAQQVLQLIRERQWLRKSWQQTSSGNHGSKQAVSHHGFTIFQNFKNFD